MFGQNPNIGNKPGNVFGQPTTPRSSTADDTGFGKIDALFGNSGQFQQSGSSPTSNLFSSQNVARNMPVFGTSGGGAKGSTAQSENLFGAATNTSNEANMFGGSGTVMPAPGFGSTGFGGGSTSQPSPVFGGGTQAVFGGFGANKKPSASKTETINLFAKAPTTSGALFGKPAATTSVTSSKAAKPAMSTNPFKTSGEDTKVLFRKKDESPQPVVNPFGGGLAQKPVFGQRTTESAASTNLFGKPVESKEETGFGKSETAFGKQDQVLFSKGPKTEKSGAELFGKKPDISNPFATKGITSGFLKKEQQNAPKTGLFGKSTTSKDGTSAPKSERPVSSSLVQAQRGQAETRPERSKASGLFGKALSEATSQSRPPVLKRSQPEDRAESKDMAKERKRRIRVDSSLDEKTQREKPKTIVRSAMAFSSEPVALAAKNIPASCNNRTTLTRHFSKFGTVTKVFSTPSKASAIIHFASHEDALQAKKLGRKIKENLSPMQFFWSSYTPTKSSASKDDEDNSQDGNQRQPKPVNVKSTLRKSIDARLKKKAERSDDVEDELSSLRGTKDTMTDRMTILKRVGRTGTPEPSSGQQSNSPERSRARSVSPVRGRVIPDPVSPSRRARGTPPPGRFTDGVVSLKSLGEVVASTANDFFTILDNRDKLIRGAMDLKNRDWAHAAAMKGTCPDMCPERERYMREDRHQLSVYEIVPGTEKVDHYRAVKEYSRSSADQEMPLPHEMRPAAVLNMTMTYLLNNIVDQGKDGMWADWYDFLWNRTRAIRKDITQQHLCDLTTVSLIEKCVRFHIYAAHRLCEEPMNCFDDKINNENLTKCLQTLKEFYHDLGVKHNIVCPHEAEFRAYMVLMNLNEGDALREAQQLPPEIRQSPEMTFALKAHAALYENNYVKFFKLALRTTFLQGCIVHRYFNQIRKKAIMVLLRAYRSISATAYPLDRIVWLLKFESIEEAQDFCEHHGMVVREDCVILEKGAYVDPEAVFGQKRAIQLIESKLRTSVGEAINGGPLPPNQIPEPMSSFDSSGRFVVSNYQLLKEEAESITPEKSDQPREVAPPPIEPLIKAGDIPYSNEVVKELTKDLFIEVISEMCHEIGNRFIQDLKVVTVAVQTLNSLVPEVTQEMTKALIVETVEELERAKKEAEARKRAELAAERQASKERASNVLIDEILESTLAGLYQQIAHEECSLVERRLQKESELRMSEVVCDELLKQSVDAAMVDAIKEFHQDNVVRRLQQLQQAEEAVQLAFVGRHFHQWKNAAAGRRRLKRVYRTFPAAPNMDLLPKQIQDLVPDSRGVIGNKINLGGSINVTLQSPDEIVKDRRLIKRSCSAHSLYFKLRQRLAWHPLNVGEVILNLMRQGQVPSKHRGSCYWKGILSLPDERSVPEEFAKWLRTKFTKGSVPMDIPSDNKSELLSLYSVSNSINTANVCVRCINGNLSKDALQRYYERQDFNAVSALIHLIFCPPEMSKSVNFWKSEEQRLDNVFGAMPNERFPVLVLLCHDKCNSRLIPEIEMWLGSRNIDRETFKLQELELDVDDSVNQLKLQEGLEWLVQKSPSPPNLTVSPVIDVVENMVTLQFSQPVYQDLASRRKTGHLDQPLEMLVAFYNDAIEYLAETVADSELQDFSWPPPEFATRHTDTLPPSTWNLTKSLEDSKNVILTMRLPEPDLIGVDTWEEGCNLVWSFLEAVADESIQSSHAELYSRVRWLLRRSQNEMADFCDVLWDDSDVGNESKFLSPNLPWTEIVMACVRQKLLELKFNPSVSGRQQNGLPRVLVYENKKLAQYQPPEIWSSAIRSNVTEEEETLEMSVLRSLKRKFECTEDSPKKSMRVGNVTVLNISPLRPAELEANQTLYELEMSVVAGKEESKALDNLLKTALQAENVSFNRSSENLHSNSFIQSQMPMYAVSPGEFQNLMRESMPTDIEPCRQSLSDELSDFRAKLQSYKRAQMLESLKLERMLLDH